MNKHLPAAEQPAALRERVEVAIEGLIALLDSLDGDADLEPNGDELDASFPERGCIRDAYQEEDWEEDATDEHDGRELPFADAAAIDENRLSKAKTLPNLKSVDYPT